MKVKWQEVELKGSRAYLSGDRLYIRGTFEGDKHHVCFTRFVYGKGEEDLYAYELIDGQLGDRAVLTDDEIAAYTDVADTARRDIRRRIDNILDDYYFD